VRSWGPRGGKLATTPTLCRRAARAALDSHELFMTLLRLDTRFAMTPSASSRSRRNSNRVLRPKPEKPFVNGFEAQTTKPPGEAYPLRLLHDLNMCHHRPQSYDLIDAVFIIHILLHSSMSPSASHRSWSPGLLVPRSKPHVCPSPLSVHRHGTTRLYLTFTLPSTTASELHTCAPQAKRHAAQPNSRHGKFTDSTQDASHVDNHSSQPNHKGTYQPCVRTVALVERIVVLQHVQI